MAKDTTVVIDGERFTAAYSRNGTTYIICGDGGRIILSVNGRCDDFRLTDLAQAYLEGQARGLADGKALGVREQIARTHEILGIDKLIAAISTASGRE